MIRYYLSFRLSKGNPLHCSLLAKDIGHALQRLTDFVAGVNWEPANKMELSVESITLSPKRGVTYEEGWL